MIFDVLSFADNSMDQDGGYSKQQTGSLTTDGEGEFQTKRLLSGISKTTDLQPTCSRLDGQKHKVFCRRLINESRKCKVSLADSEATKKIHLALAGSIYYTLSRSPTEGFQRENIVRAD